VPGEPIRDPIRAFLGAGPFGVAGASSDRKKFGNKVLRCYLQHGLDAHPVHPSEREVEGRPCYPDVASLPADVGALSIITPPPVTEKIVDAALARGIRHLWMQPGAESAPAVARARAAGANVIQGGPCLLVELGFRERG
jgi:predicted CoA-binding protein